MQIKLYFFSQVNERFFCLPRKIFPAPLYANCKAFFDRIAIAKICNDEMRIEFISQYPSVSLPTIPFHQGRHHQAYLPRYFVLDFNKHLFNVV